MRLLFILYSLVLRLRKSFRIYLYNHVKNGYQIAPDVSIGKHVRIENSMGGQININHGTQLHDGVLVLTYGGDITIGENCSINPYTVIYGHGNARIGNNVLIAGHCMIVPNNHIFSERQVSILLQGNESKGIEIEDDVWIGHGCSILDGVVVGKGAVIAAGSVVNKDIEPYSVVGGNPAKKIKDR